MKKKSAGKANISKKTGDNAASKSIKKTPVDPQYHFDPLKNDMVRQALVTLLWKREELTYPALAEQLRREVGKHFNGDVDLYIEKVCHFLMEKKLLEITPDKKPTHYRLAQKLDADEGEKPAGDIKEADSNDEDSAEVDTEQEAL